MSEQRDPFGLDRYIEAQADSYAQALAELRSGRKESHWSWYVLPQVLGLGASEISVYYAIRSLDEARAYLAHPLLGARLRECIAALDAHASLGAEDILGEIDALKFRSCLTLFAEASGAETIFVAALQKHFGGSPDPATLEILGHRQNQAT